MSDQFVAEIRIFGGNFAPQGWALCNGQLMEISQNTALFSLLGTDFGGDGKSNFALPNLQGCAPLHWGQGPGLSPYSIGQTGGEAQHTLLSTEIPAHTHTGVGAAETPTTAQPAGAVFAHSSGRFPPNMYASGGDGTVMNPAAIVAAGGGLPHNNLQPYLVLNFIIALTGIFPPRS